MGAPSKLLVLRVLLAAVLASIAAISGVVAGTALVAATTGSGPSWLDHETPIDFLYRHPVFQDANSSLALYAIFMISGMVSMASGLTALGVVLPNRSSAGPTPDAGSWVDSEPGSLDVGEIVRTPHHEDWSIEHLVHRQELFDPQSSAMDLEDELQEVGEALAGGAVMVVGAVGRVQAGRFDPHDYAEAVVGASNLGLVWSPGVGLIPPASILDIVHVRSPTRTTALRIGWLGGPRWYLIDFRWDHEDDLVDQLLERLETILRTSRSSSNPTDAVG